MSTRAKLITILSIVAVLIVAALLYFVPRSTPVDLSFHVVKLDKNGYDLGTAQVRIQGEMLDYLFQESRLDAEIELADKAADICLINGKNGPDEISCTEVNGYQLLRLAGYFYDKQADTSAFLDIVFTEEMDRFVFYLPQDKVYYVGSASGSYDTLGVLDYFNSIAPNLAPER